MLWIGLALLGLGGLTACASANKASVPPATFPAPTATAAPIVAAVPPALAPAIPALRLCARVEGIPLAVLDVPQTAPLPPAANFRLWWSAQPPAGMSAFQIGNEHLTVIAHAAASSHTNLASLWRIITGQIVAAPNRNGTPIPIALWLPLPDSASGERLNAWLAGAPLRSDALLAPSPQVMLQAVSDDQAVLGVLPAAWLQTPAARNAAVQEVALPALPDAWQAPLLALLPPNAPPTARALVGCLQQGAGRGALAPLYGTP